MSDIRAFLARAVPWPTAEQPGFVDIHWTNRDQATGAFRGLTGYAFTDHNLASGHTYGMLRSPVDLYVCMSLQAEAELPSLSSGGKPRRRAMRSWDNALLLRSHWIDVDVKPGFFATTADAMAAFTAWRIKVGMPEPTFIVMTGSGGFHAHWVYDEPLTREQWLPTAYALQQALKVEHFPCDYGVIVNPACILRIPGTKNHKLTPPADVVLAQSLPFTYPSAFIAAQLAPYKVPYALPVTTAAAATRLNFKPNPKLAGLTPGPRLDAGVTEWMPKIEEVATVCPFVEETLANHGKGYNEPLWRESLRIASFCEDGSAVAHRISDGHDGYDKDATDAKFSQIAQRHGGGKVGWPQCRTINSAGASQCGRCPHFVDNKSPFNYAVVLPPPAPPPAPALVTTLVAPPAPLPPMQRWLPDHTKAHFGFGDLPDGYQYLNDGRVQEKIEKPDPNNSKLKTIVWEEVFPNPIADLRAHSPSTERNGVFGVSFWVRADHTHEYAVVIKAVDLTNPIKFSEACTQQGGIAANDMSRLRRLCLSFREQLFARRRATENAEALGWSVGEGQSEPDGFCIGGRRYSPNGVTEYTPTDVSVARKYEPCGSLDVWKQAASLLTDQQRPDINCIIAASFAAPLIYWTGISGSVLSVWSNASGIGKTHAMRVAQAVWGNPKTGMGALNDTSNFVTGTLANIRHLPFFYDELRQEQDTKKMVDLIFGMGQGKGKGRMTASAEIKEVQGFATLLTVASNLSMMGYINDHVQTTAAGINRVFELEIKPAPFAPGLIDSTVAQTINGSLENNFGRAGVVYAQYLGTHAKWVKASVASMLSSFNTALKANHDERFWIATIAVLTVGARFANNLGLTAIDEAQLVRYLVGRFEENRRYRNSAPVDMGQATNVLRYVQDYVNVRRENMLVTDIIWQQVGRPPVHHKPLQKNSNVALDAKQIFIRIAETDRIMRISQANFGAWLTRDCKVQRDVIIDAAVNILGAKRIKSSLTIGMDRLVSARENVLEFDLSTLPDLFG